jgi:predicted phosphodiesterase
MRTLFFSDVHSDLSALNKLRASIQKESVDRIVFLGDLIDLGNEPNECVEIVNDLAQIKIYGNHDIHPPAVFKLTEPNRQILSKFENGHLEDNYSLYHAGPRQNWQYIQNNEDAQAASALCPSGICFVGHNHKNFIWQSPASMALISGEFNLIIDPRNRYVIGVGSISQPRDGSQFPSYCIYDDVNKTVYFKKAKAVA